jgi:hypothetical protein
LPLIKKIFVAGLKSIDFPASSDYLGDGSKWQSLCIKAKPNDYSLSALAIFKRKRDEIGFLYAQN